MVSTDKPEDNKRFAEKEEANFVLLSDPEKQAGAAYGVLMGPGYAKRWTFYIGKDGTIQKIDEKVRAPKAGEDTVTALTELGLLGK